MCSNICRSSPRYRRRFFSRTGRRHRTSPLKKVGVSLEKAPSTTFCESKSLSSAASPKKASMKERSRRWLLHFKGRVDDLLGSSSVPEVITIDSTATCQTERISSVGCLIASDVDTDSGSSSASSTSLSFQMSPNHNEIVEQNSIASHQSQLSIEKEKELVQQDSNGTIVSAIVAPEKVRREPNKDQSSSYERFRLVYLIVYTAIMLADGLQGTHLYVLYESYGYSVSSLYSLGFISGAFTSPFIGPVVDRIGRKKAAMLYCFLEIIINLLEQYPIFLGLIASRVIGGITTNLLFSVFESWLVTEHRRRGFEEEKLELIIRDSTIASNSAAIVSGYIAHSLAAMFGAVGPFEGAVTFTGIAFLLVGLLWSENFGTESDEMTTFRGHMVNAYRKIVDDTKISRIGLIQGLTEGSLQTFVFLWSPALRSFSINAPQTALGLDIDGNPAYGLIFGAFMACGVMGSFVEPIARKFIPVEKTVDKDERRDASDVGLLSALCYLLSAILLLTPCLVENDSPYSFSICLGAFLIYEFLVGLYLPCEGVIRSIFMPNESMCSLMTMLRVIVNVAVAVGVISTNFVSLTSAFSSLSVMMLTATFLQLSLLRN